jgi:uncharacterized protein YqeY
VSIKARIEADLKDAMRSGDQLARDTLRMVLSAMKYQRIEAQADLDQKGELAVLQTCVKTRKDSVEQYEKAGREDLASKERREIEIIQRYLPQQLSEEETRALVERAIAALGITSKKDVGKLMKAIMAEHKDEVDGKAVQRIAGELLP